MVRLHTSCGRQCNAYTSALMSYMRDDLKVRWDRLYLAPADPELSDQWNWNLTPVGQ